MTNKITDERYIHVGTIKNENKTSKGRHERDVGHLKLFPAAQTRPPGITKNSWFLLHRDSLFYLFTYLPPDHFCKF